MTSESEMRPKSLCTRSSASPNQFARSATFVVGWLMIAGVHSIVWIFASSAALISRAFWKSRSSSQCGYSALRRSQIELCSIEKMIPSRSIPSQKPGSCSGLRSRSGPRDGSEPSRPMSSLPSVPDRTACCCFSETP
jgi:hypothetical protein